MKKRVELSFFPSDLELLEDLAKKQGRPRKNLMEKIILDYLHQKSQ